MPVTEIAFVMYAVTDMPRALDFYQNTLGLTRDGDGEAGRWEEFDIGGSTLVLTTIETALAPGAGQSLALEVDDLPAFRAALAAKGVESPQDFESPVCWMAPIKDPDGNGIVLHQRKPGHA